MSGGILFNSNGRIFTPSGMVFMPDPTSSPSTSETPAMASGDVLVDSNGRVWLDPSGRVILDDGTGNCCVIPARKCSDGSLTTLMKPKNQIPSFPYFENVGGICYEWLATDSPRSLACGGTLIGSGTAISGCSDPSCGGSAPCGCAFPTGMSTSYVVSGWGSLAACSGCDPDSTDPAWDGTLYNFGTGCVWWAADPAFDPLSINGYMLDISYTQILLNTSVSPCRWELYIACGSATNPTKTMWKGYKTTGSTPAGTYNYAGSDCGNTTPTMTVA